MDRKDLFEIEGMTDALADAVMAVYGKNTPKDRQSMYAGYIPKSRFDEVNDAKKALEARVKELEKEVEGIGNLKAQIKELEESNRKSEETVKAVRIEGAVNLALKEAGAKNIRAVLPFIDVSEIGEDGKVVGLDEQIKALKESEESGFLFVQKQQVTNPKGVSPANNGTNPKGGTLTKERFMKMGYRERLELLNNDPDTYNAMMKESE